LERGQKIFLILIRGIQTMWEHFLLKRGFRNVIKGGQVTGFQFKITIPYYRGLWVSAAFQGFAVRVDGVVYPKDKISLKIGSKTYLLTEVDQAYEDFWYFGDPATVVVEKAGGLAPGLHKVECGIGYERSYGTRETPPAGYNFQYSAGFSMQTMPAASPKAGTPAAGTTAPPSAGGDSVMAGLTSCSLDMVLVI
jgi:hypothetical protein